MGYLYKSYTNYQIKAVLYGNMYFVQRVSINGGKHFYHNMIWIIALFTDNVKLLVSFLLYIVPEMGGWWVLWDSRSRPPAPVTIEF